MYEVPTVVGALTQCSYCPGGSKMPQPTNYRLQTQFSTEMYLIFSSGATCDNTTLEKGIENLPKAAQLTQRKKKSVLSFISLESCSIKDMDHIFPPCLTEFSSILVCPHPLKSPSFHVPTLPTPAQPEAVNYLIHIIRIIINFLLSTNITNSPLFTHFCPFWQNALKMQNLSEPSPYNTNALEA